MLIIERLLGWLTSFQEIKQRHKGLRLPFINFCEQDWAFRALQVCLWVVLCNCLDETFFGFLRDANLVFVAKGSDFLIPKEDGVDPVVADPAILTLTDSLNPPTATAWHAKLVAQDASDG